MNRTYQNYSIEFCDNRRPVTLFNNFTREIRARSFYLKFILGIKVIKDWDVDDNCLLQLPYPLYEGKADTSILITSSKSVWQINYVHSLCVIEEELFFLKSCKTGQNCPRDFSLASLLSEYYNKTCRDLNAGLLSTVKRLIETCWRSYKQYERLYIYCLDDHRMNCSIPSTCRRYGWLIVSILSLLPHKDPLMSSRTLYMAFSINDTNKFYELSKGLFKEKALENTKLLGISSSDSLLNQIEIKQMVKSKNLAIFALLIFFSLDALLTSLFWATVILLHYIFSITVSLLISKLYEVHILSFLAGMPFMILMIWIGCFCKVENGAGIISKAILPVSINLVSLAFQLMDGTNASINLVICSYTMLILYVLFGIYILPILIPFKLSKQSRTLINCSTANSQGLIMKDLADNGNDRQTVKLLEKLVNFNTFPILPVIYVCLLCGTISLQIVFYSLYRTPEYLRPQFLDSDHPLMNYKRIYGEFDSIGSYLNMTIVVDLGSDEFFSWEFIEWASNSCRALKMNNYTATVWKKVRKCFMNELYTVIKKQCRTRNNTSNSLKSCITKEMIENISLGIIKKSSHKYLFIDHLLRDNTNGKKNFYALSLQLDYLIQPSLVEEECIRQNMLYNWNNLKEDMPKNYETTIHFPDLGFGVRRLLSWQPITSALLQLFSGVMASLFLQIDSHMVLIMGISVLLSTFSSLGLMLLMNNLISVFHIMAIPHMITIVSILHLLTITLVTQFKGENRLKKFVIVCKHIFNPTVIMFSTFLFITLFLFFADSPPYIYNFFEVGLITISVAWLFIYCFFLPFISISSVPSASLRDYLLRNKLSDVVSSKKSSSVTPIDEIERKEGSRNCINALSGDVISIIKGKRRKVGVYNLQIDGDLLIENNQRIDQRESLDKQKTKINEVCFDKDNSDKQINTSDDCQFLKKRDLTLKEKNSEFVAKLVKALESLKSNDVNHTETVVDKENKKDTYNPKRRGTLERIAEEECTDTNSSRPLNTSNKSLLSDSPGPSNFKLNQNFQYASDKRVTGYGHNILKSTNKNFVRDHKDSTFDDNYSLKAEQINTNSQSRTTVISSWSSNYSKDENLAVVDTENSI